MLGAAQLEEGFGVQRWFRGRLAAQGLNQRGAGAWLCWDLEPAADVLGGSGCLPLEGGGWRGITAETSTLLCRYPAKGASISAAVAPSPCSEGSIP